MSTHVIKNDTDRAALFVKLQQPHYPFTVDIRKGKHRSVEQNKLNRLWMKEVSRQIPDTFATAEDVRAFCKLTIAVPILREENTHFKEQYDKVVKPLSYESKLAIMSEPLDMPCTRLMTTEQESRYLDKVLKYFSDLGLKLTIPEWRR